MSASAPPAAMPLPAMARRPRPPSFPSSGLPVFAATAYADGGALRSKSVTHYAFARSALGGLPAKAAFASAPDYVNGPDRGRRHGQGGPSDRAVRALPTWKKKG